MTRDEIVMELRRLCSSNKPDPLCLIQMDIQAALIAAIEILKALPVNADGVVKVEEGA